MGAIAVLFSFTGAAVWLIYQPRPLASLKPNAAAYERQATQTVKCHCGS
jgi:hypothetical protein